MKIIRTATVAGSLGSFCCGLLCGFTQIENRIFGLHEMPVRELKKIA